MISMPKTTYESVKLIARIWMLEKGCSWIHSSNVTGEECRQWFDELPEHLIESVEDSGVLACQIAYNQNAYLIKKRTPDPNFSNRKVNNLWIIVDPEERLTGSQVANFASHPVFASSQSEFESLSMKWLNQLRLHSIEPTTSAGNSEKASAPVTLSQFLRRVLSFIAGLCLIVFVPWNGLFRDTSDHENSGGETGFIESETDDRWGDEQIRVEIENAVQDAGGLVEYPTNDEESLEAFVHLFRGYDAIPGLTAVDRQAIDSRKKIETPHPFLDFLAQFPDEEISVPTTLNQLQSRGAMYYAALEPLVRHFQESIEVDLDGILISAAVPEELVRCLRNRLSYRDFYNLWHAQYSPSQEKDPLIEKWDSEDPANAWQSKLREHIKKHYYGS